MRISAITITLSEEETAAYMSSDAAVNRSARKRIDTEANTLARSCPTSVGEVDVSICLHGEVEDIQGWTMEVA